MEELFERIRRYVDGHHDEILALQEEMVNTESGSRQLKGMAATDDIPHRGLESADAKMWVLPVGNAGDALVAEWSNGSPKAPLLFVSHVSTVFKEEIAEDNPFRIDEQGRTHSPGVLDMKADLVIVVHAIKALAVAGSTGRPVKCVFTGDKGNPHMLFDTKRVMTEEIEGTAAAPNFEIGFPDNHLVVGRKGGGLVSLTVHGVLVHSGNAPEKKHSAVLEATRKIVALEACNDISWDKLTNYGKITGGTGENTILDLCTISIGVRFPSTEIKNEILNTLEQATSRSIVPNTRAELDASRLMECMDTTGGVMALFHHVQRAAVRYGIDEPDCFQVGGLSDSGITVVCGILIVCTMGVRGEGNHTPIEYAKVESLFKRCTLTACVAGFLEGSFTE